MNRLPVQAILSLVCLQSILISFSSVANSQSNFPDSAILLISSNKTTSVIFPHLIQSTDRGSKHILIQKVASAENVLQIKAAMADFPETSLTVITADSKLYTFIVRYCANPAHLIIRVDSTPNIFEKLAWQKRSMRGVSDEKYDMRLWLKGLFIENDILYWQLVLENASNISYDTELMRFYIKDKKQPRRTAVQELDQLPLYIYGNTGSVAGHCSMNMVVALPKFTMPRKKEFFIEVLEKNGGRNLRLQINNRKLLKAKSRDGI